MVGTARDTSIEKATSSAAWQLGTIHGETPGTIFRIRADHRREIVAQLQVECRANEIARGPHQLCSDVAAVVRCLGLPALASSEAAHAPVTVTVEATAIEAPVEAWDAFVCEIVEHLDIDPCPGAMS